MTDADVCGDAAESIRQRIDAVRIEVDLEESVMGPYLAEATGSFAPLDPHGKVGAWPEPGRWHVEYMPGNQDRWAELRDEILEVLEEIALRSNHCEQHRSTFHELQAEAGRLLGRVDDLPHLGD